MTNPKIRVEADFSGIFADLQKLETRAKQILKNAGGQNLGGQASGLKKLLADVEKVADRIESLGKKGLPTQGLEVISKRFHEIGDAAQKVERRVSGKSNWSSWISTLSDELEQAAKGEQELTRLAELMARKRTRVTREEAREYAKSWESLRGKFSGTRFAKMGLDDVLDSRKSKVRSEILQELGLERKRHIENFRRIAMPSSAFGVVRNAATGAAEAEAGAFSITGAARFAGLAGVGALGLGALGLVRGTMGQIGSAQDEAIGYTDLRRSIGLTAADFEGLRTSVRAATDGLGVAYNESQRLAEQFVRTSGTISGSRAVFEGVHVSSAFARGYGINPALATQLFGTAGRFGERNNRRLALLIGEAVGKSNLSSKLPEVLSSLSGYLSSAGTASLSRPNAAGFLDMLSSLSTTGITGLTGNPAGSMSIMMAVDDALRRGGAAGEASKNFSLGLYSRMAPGFNAFDMGLVNAQGAFGTFAGAFGPESAAYKMAKARGDAGLMREYLGLSKIDGTILGHQMSGLISEYGGNTRGLMSAVAAHFGTSAPGAAALITAPQSKGGFGSFEQRLLAAGVDTSSMNPKRIARLAELVYGDNEAIRSQKDKLLAMSGLSERERSSLLTGTSDDQRSALLRLTERYDMRDPGDQARQAQIDMANQMQELVTGLLPAVNTIKEGIVDLVRFFNGISGHKSIFLEDYDRQQRMREFQSQIHPGAADQIARMRHMTEYLAQDRDLKLSKAQAAGIVGNLAHETGRFKNLQEINPTRGLGGFGYAQWTGPRRKAFLQWAKEHRLSPTTTAANLGFLKHELLTSENVTLKALRNAGTVNEAAKVFMDLYERPGIDNLPAREREAMLAFGDESRRYIEPIAGQFPINQQASRSNVSVEGRFTLHDRSGTELAPPILIKENPAPSASGDIKRKPMYYNGPE